jgi:hypothetical protein
VGPSSAGVALKTLRNPTRGVGRQCSARMPPRLKLQTQPLALSFPAATWCVRMNGPLDCSGVRREPPPPCSGADCSEIGQPNQTILARKRKGLVAALSLGYPEYSMIAGIVHRDGAMVVEDQTLGLGEDSVAQLVLRSYGAQRS